MYAPLADGSSNRSMLHFVFYDEGTNISGKVMPTDRHRTGRYKIMVISFGCSLAKPVKSDTVSLLIIQSSKLLFAVSCFE